METGDYGDDDTIHLPEGVIEGEVTWDGHISNVSFQAPVEVTGQGRGVSVLDNIEIIVSGYYGASSAILQDFTIRGGISGWGSDYIEIDNVEVDGMGGSIHEVGISVMSKDVTIRNSHIHNGRTHGGSGLSLVAAFCYDFMEEGDLTCNLLVESTTISDANRGIALQSVGGNGHGAQMNATIKNTTFSNIFSDEAPSNPSEPTAGIEVVAVDESDEGPSGAQSIINLTTINNTFDNIYDIEPGEYKATAISELVYSENTTINHTMQNNLFASGNGDDAVNYSRLEYDAEEDEFIEVTNHPNFSLTSLGGSLSSDGSLSTWLNQSTDKHNQTSLASFLGILGDNGGPVPTLALLSGSPAIDSGTNASTYVSTDARGIARPQGLAYDSGAYEVLGDSDGGSNSDSGSVYVSTPGGNDGNSGSSVDVSGIPTIAVRPTFSGTTTPNSNVLVTVNSNPVTCSTVSDSNGNWSCTLPSDVEPGTHTVLVEVRDPDTNALLHTYGPYTVNVLGDSTTIDSNSELANTGVSSTLTVVASMVSGLLGVGGIILNKLRKLKDQARYVGR